MTSFVAVSADLLVAVLLVATIATSVRLSRQMVRLKQDESAMRATIADLIAATDAAERSIAGLRGTVQDSEQALAERLAAAMRMSARLAEQVAAGDGAIARMGEIAEASRHVAPPPPTRAAPVVAPAPVAMPRETGGLRDTILAAREIAARSARRLDGRAA